LVVQDKARSPRCVACSSFQRADAQFASAFLATAMMCWAPYILCTLILLFS
jgi:hypothetical protein